MPMAFPEYPKSQFILKWKQFNRAHFLSKFNHPFLIVIGFDRDKTGEILFRTSTRLPKPSIDPSDEPRVIFLDPEQSTKSTRLISVGRTNNNDIILQQKAISKLHAFFKYAKDGTFTLHDAGSLNGTIVDGEKLTKENPITLEGGTKIQFGGMFHGVFHTPETMADQVLGFKE